MRQSYRTTADPDVHGATRPARTFDRERDRAQVRPQPFQRPVRSPARDNCEGTVRRGRGFGSCAVASNAACIAATVSGDRRWINCARRLASAVCSGVRPAVLIRHPRIGQPRETRQIVCLVPDQAKEFVHLMHQAGAGRPRLSMLQRREIGGWRPAAPRPDAST